jgi:coenzyme F420-reducing hydrogenase delta subunit
MKNNMIRISILIILTTLSFQLYAKETNNFPASSDKKRLEKLELGVAELGAERERARTIRQGTHDDKETRYNIINPSNKTTRVISNTERLEKLERGVSELGAERERIRAQVQDRK